MSCDVPSLEENDVQVYSDSQCQAVKANLSKGIQIIFMWQKKPLHVLSLENLREMTIKDILISGVQCFQ